MKKNNYPYLECSIIEVKHESETSIGPTPKSGMGIKAKKPVGMKIVGPPTFKVFYANNGSVPSFTAYLYTFYKKQDPVSLSWEHEEYKKEIIAIQPGGQGFFEYDAPKFGHFKPPRIPSTPPIQAARSIIRAIAGCCRRDPKE